MILAGKGATIRGGSCPRSTVAAVSGSWAALISAPSRRNSVFYKNTESEASWEERGISVALVLSCYIPAEGHPLTVWNRESLVSFKVIEA